ncbi:MAG: site-specific integrase [bacterium]|nr:site-specific integrase [bacterium]
MQRMLDGPLGRNERTRTRNRALLVVMWRAGLRVSEALGLRMDDLRPDEGGVWVRRGKGGKPRLAGMDPESFEAMLPWLELRRELGLDPAGPVFCTFNGNAVESSYMRHMCRRLRAKLGLSKRVHAHALRHTHAHELFREGVAEKLIQVQLGHASLDGVDRQIPAEDWRQRGRGGCSRAGVVAMAVDILAGIGLFGVI